MNIQLHFKIIFSSIVYVGNGYERQAETKILQCYWGAERDIFQLLSWSLSYNLCVGYSVVYSQSMHIKKRVL